MPSSSATFAKVGGANKDDHRYKDKMASQIVRDEIQNRTIGQGTRRGSAVWRARLQKTKDEILNMDEHAMRASSAAHVYLKPKKVKLKLMWGDGVERLSRRYLKERFAKYGRVKHVTIASIANGNYAHITFRTEQAAELAIQGHAGGGTSDILEYAKEEPATKVLVHWEGKGEHDEDNIRAAFKSCGDIHYVKMEKGKAQKAIICFESQTGAESALSHAADFEDFLISEWCPVEEVPTDIVRASRLAAHVGHVIPEEEVKALRELFLALDGPNWKNRYGWENTDSLTTKQYCTKTDYHQWWGVSIRGGRIVRIELPNNNLKGRLPNSIGNFKLLEALWLHNNEISGDVPTTIGNLTRLHSLYLHQNQFKRLPSTIQNLTKVELLGLRKNNWDIGGVQKDLIQWLPAVKLDDDWPLEQC
jgi:hypothetical protein